MSEPTPNAPKQQAKVLTVSDGVAHGVRDDASGRALVDHLGAAGFDVVDHRVTADGADLVATTLVEMADGFAGLIVSTGGTGFAPRDQTPEGTRSADRTRGAGTGRGDATLQPARTPVPRRGRHPGPARSSPTRPAARRAASSNSTPCSTSCRTPCASSTTPTPPTDPPSFIVCDKISAARSAEILSQTWIWAPVAWAAVLRLVLPKGSLEKATLELFEAADLAGEPILVGRLQGDHRRPPDRRRCGSCGPQEIPVYVAEGLFDIGITGRDWIEETGSDVVSLGELQYSKATSRPIKLVVAVAGDSAGRIGEGSPRRRARAVGVPRADASASSPNTASTPTCACPTAPPRRRSPTSPTASSRSPRPVEQSAPPACKVIDTILTSYTEVVANPAVGRRPGEAQGDGAGDDAAQRRARGPRQGAAQAERREDRFDAVLAVLPSMKSPTISKLAGGGYAVETVVEKRTHQPGHPGAHATPARPICSRS